MIVIKLIILHLGFYTTLVVSYRFVRHPDVGLSTPEIVKKHGYPLEVHEVITEDGYILKNFRIPRGKNSDETGEPVLFLHGLSGCSENFINAGPNSSTSYFLADHGYDVWLMNSRGNLHSRRHVAKNPDEDKSFWHHGWHEVGIFDIPAVAEYILNVTNRSQLLFIGHSSGSTSYLTLMADRPEYGDKFKVAVLLAPSAYMTNLLIYRATKIVLAPLREAGVEEFLPRRLNDFVNRLLTILCSEVTYFAKVCATLINIGRLTSQMDMITPQHVVQFSPAGFALQAMIHYAQIWESESFVKYDYGRRENWRLYHSKTPPPYNLTNVKGPVALFYAPQDQVLPKEGVMKLARELPNLEQLYGVPTDDYGHVDFIFGKNNRELVNKPILKIFKKYSNEEKRKNSNDIVVS